jgi:hypothetical protein
MLSDLLRCCLPRLLTQLFGVDTMLRLRPTKRAPSHRARSRPQAWANVPWWHSLVFVAAVLIIAFAVIIRPRSGSSTQPNSTITYHVHDSATGAPLNGVTVSVGGQTLTSDANGLVKLPVAQVEQDVIIQMPGYVTIYSSASSNSPKEQSVSLAIAPTPTATEIPPTPIPPTPTSVPLAEGDTFAGTVVDADDIPIAGAVVLLGSKFVETNADGEFSIEYRGGDPEARISAPGYADLTMVAAQKPKITLERFVVKGVYLNGTAAGEPAIVDAVIELIDQTELNAVVIDTKDSIIFYDSQIDFFRDAGAVDPVYDAKELVQRFHDHGIYVIARQVAYKDPLVAEAHPELSIKDEETGKPWRGWAGEAWVNPLKKALYQPNVDLAVETAEMGFDEIQYDYIRFPDGDLAGADFGKAYDNVDKRIAAVTTLLKMTRDALRPMGVKLSADVFGWMLLVDNDQGIGQRFQDVAAVVDFISPMVYPSHFPEGSIAVPGHPNDYPYDVISISLSLGMAKIPGGEFKMRPWLQDFTLPGMSDYGPDEIRAEIDAAEDSGSSGWMVWNVNANYVDGAYKAADA